MNTGSLIDTERSLPARQPLGEGDTSIIKFPNVVPLQ